MVWGIYPASHRASQNDRVQVANSYLCLQSLNLPGWDPVPVFHLVSAVKSVYWAMVCHGYAKDYQSYQFTYKRKLGMSDWKEVKRMLLSTLSCQLGMFSRTSRNAILSFASRSCFVFPTAKMSLEVWWHNHVQARSNEFRTHHGYPVDEPVWCLISSANRPKVII